MADNYFSFLYGENGNQEKPVSDEANKQESEQAAVVQDEAIGKPWTHRFTIYCANPSKDFLDGIKKSECVVAVYEKTKETAEKPEEKSPSNE